MSSVLRAIVSVLFGIYFELFIIFYSSYYLWEIFVLGLSSHLLFTRNRSSVQITLCDKTLNSSCEILCPHACVRRSAMRCDAISKISPSRFSEFTGTIGNRFLTNQNPRSISVILQINNDMTSLILPHSSINAN